MQNQKLPLAKYGFLTWFIAEEKMKHKADTVLSQRKRITNFTKKKGREKDA